MRISLLFSLCALFLFAACESDELSPDGQDPNKKVSIIPTHLEGEQYIAYQFKISVKDVPLAQATIYWDFDEGQGKEEIAPAADGSVIRIFFQAKIHTVRVWAYDSTDALIGADSIRVDIRLPAPFVKVIPQTTDTLLFVTSSGVPIGQLSFKLRTSLPETAIDAAWDFGDGSPVFQEQFTQSSVSHKFTGAGTFMVRVTVKEKTGFLLGTDSVKVTIRMPEPALSHLLNTAAVSVWLSIDSSVAAGKDPLFVDPFSVGLPIHGHPASQFTDRSFSIVYENNEMGSKLCLDTIRGRLSDDLRSIEEVYVSVNDTGEIEFGKGILRYSFRLTDLEFLALTNDKIVYRTRSADLSDFAHDILFYSSSPRNVPRGILDGFPGTQPPERKPGVYALVIFDR